MRTLTLIFAALATACTSSTSPTPGESGSQLQLVVAPLDLDNVTDASYRLTIRNRDGDLVWTRSAVTSSQFGNSRGDIAYVAPCDASRSPNTVALEIEALYNGTEPLPTTAWSNPAPVGSPVSLTTDCFENRDTLVEFNLTILRSANQGFFDIAVNFDQIFCSAKLDCATDEGPLHLLHNPATGQRDTTMVMGFACTAGPARPGEPELPTWLWLDSIRITCGDTVTTVDPSRGPGNAGAYPPLLFQTGSYRGDEELAGIDKCYWNSAFGVDLAALATHPDGCVLDVRGTASSTFFDNGQTPPRTLYPYIHWQVRFAADPTGTRLVCGAAETPLDTHPLNGEDSQVETRYTNFDGTRFGFAMACGADGEVERVGSYECAGKVPGRSDTVEVTPTEGGLVVTIGALSSAPYALPASVAGRTVGGASETCCVDPCCAQ
jgi:hypothetical protein